jgi:tetratricopeptide (TPR) repeat protein
MVLAERLVVLYAKSGLGKTSLINAGLMKPLRDKNFLPFRVTFTDSAVDPLQTVYSKITDSVREYQIDHKPGETTTLWQYFKTVEFWSSENILLTPILILDQCEELFTLHSAERRKNLSTQLADLVRGRMPKDLLESLKSDDQLPYSEKPPDVKVVICIREDFLGQLEEMSQEIPDILHKRFRLLSLNRNQARQAITEPAQVDDAEIHSAKFCYASESVDAILDFLCKRKEKDKVMMTDEVEPFQLQVLCQDIESKVLERPKDKGTNVIVQKSDLGGEEGMQRVLKDFYNDKISRLSSFWVRTRVRMLFGNRLISDTDRRLSVEEEQIERKAKVPKSVLTELVNSRLLRAEPRVGSVYYELSHDTLVQPIRNAHRELKRRYGMIGGSILFLVIAVLCVGIPQFNASREISNLEAQVNDFEKSKVQATLKGVGQRTDFTSDSPYVNPYKDLAFAYAKRGKYKKAFEACESAVQKGIAPAKLWPDFFAVLTIDRKEDQIEKLLEVASRFNSKDPKYYYYLALEFRKTKRHDREIENYKKAIQLDRKYSDAYGGLGFALHDQKKYDEAIKNYQTAINLNTNDPYVYINLANIFSDRKKKYDEAIRSYQKAIELDPNNVYAYNGLGNVFRDQKRYDEAISNYQKAIELVPNNVYAYNGLGNVFSDQKKYDGAIKNYRKAIELDPMYVYAYDNLGNVFRDQKKYDEAIKNYQKAIELDPNNVYAYDGLGNVFRDQKKYAEAIKNYEKAIEVDPTDAFPYQILGRFYFDNLPPNYPKAYELQEKAHNLARSDIDIKTDLAEASLAVERFDKASALAREMLNEKGVSIAQTLAMQFVSISSSIFLDKRPEAYSQLRNLAAYFRSIPNDYERGWKYAGSKNFIATTGKLKESDKALIGKLIEILESPKPDADKKLKELKLAYPEIFKR